MRRLRAAGKINDRRRNHRTVAGDFVCDCPAYKKRGMPVHRQFGGACTLGKWVRRFFDPTHRECRGCHNLDQSECQVVNGTESAWQCPALRQHIADHEIRLYGRAKAEKDRCERSAHT